MAPWVIYGAKNEGNMRSEKKSIRIRIRGHEVEIIAQTIPPIQVDDSMAAQNPNETLERGIAERRRLERRIPGDGTHRGSIACRTDPAGAYGG